MTTDPHNPQATASADPIGALAADPGLRIFRNAVLVLPLAVLPGFWASPAHGLAALLSSITLLANFRALSILGPRLVLGASSAEGDPWLPLVGGALVIKFGVLLLVFQQLVLRLPPEGVALGFLPILVGTLVTAFQLTGLEDESTPPHPLPEEA